MTPLHSFTWGTNTEVLCYLGSDGDVHAMALSRPAPGDWASMNLTQAAHASTVPAFPNPSPAQLLAGYPFVVLDPHGQTIEDTVHVVYLGVGDGRLHECYASGNTSSLSWNDHSLPGAMPLGALPLTGSVPTTPLGGYSFVVYNSDGSTRESTEHVIYLDQNGALHELWFTHGGNWTDNLLPTQGKPLVTSVFATPIATFPFVAVWPPGVAAEATEHVIYIDTNHRLHELWKPAGGGYWSDTVLPGNPLVLNEFITPLAAYPFFALDSNDNLTEISEHIIYVGADNLLHELYNVRQPNQTGWTDAVLHTEVPPLVTAVQTTPLAGFGFFSAIIVLLCYKQTIGCKIVLWAKEPRQAHNRNALRHIWKAWRKPQGMPIVLFR